MNHCLGRFVPRGTILICPRCREPQAVISVDVWPDQTWDWRLIIPLTDSAVRGVSSCCMERYVTFSGMFYTQEGPL